MVTSVQPSLPGLAIPRRCLDIHQRRYLGNKRQLLPWLESVLHERVGAFSSFADIFSGTGVVAHFFNRPDRPIVANELLLANWHMLCAFLSAQPVDMSEYRGWLERLSSLDPSDDNYASREYGGRYFSKSDARRIGCIRESIEKSGVSGRLRSALIASLLYSIDRVAHTCGHYDAYRSGVSDGERFELVELLLCSVKQNAGNRIIRGDANELARTLEADVVYLDPPYNSRQYSDLYHLLENIARWDKAALDGKARKCPRESVKSLYNKKQAPAAFAELIGRLNCRYIAVSYNNMGVKGDPRSQNRISDDAMLSTLAQRGPVEMFERPYRPFTAGRGTVENHTERLFLCRVTNDPHEVSS